MNHIQLNLGNVVTIVAVSMVGGIAVVGALHFLSRKDVPVLSPVARGSVDFAHSFSAGKAA